MSPYDAQLRECLTSILALQRRGVSTTSQWACVHQSLCEALRRLLGHAMAQGLQKAHAHDALFALCAWADEVGMAQPASAKVWRNNGTVLRFFAPADTGAAFYTRLDALLQHPQADALRAYYFCLALGFEGQHKSSTARTLLMVRIEPWLGTPGDRFASSSMEHLPRSKIAWASLWLPAMALGMGTSLYLLLSMFVQRDAANYVSSIEALLQG